MKFKWPSSPKGRGLILFASYLMAFINGFRMPNLWSINYYIPSIFDGFYRRSLAGSILYFLGNLRFDYYFIASIQIIIFITLNAMIIRAWRNDDGAFKWIWPLFLVSSAGGYFFHEIGYIDQLLYLLLFIAVSCNSILIGSLIVLSGLWFHELALFTIAPLYIAFLVLNRRSWREVSIVGVLLILFFGVIYLFFQTVSGEALSLFLSSAQLQSNYPVRIDYYDVFSNRFIGGRFQLYYTSREVLDTLLLFPLWTLSGIVFSKAARTIEEKWLYFFVGILAAFSPMILGVFGWDCHRWIFLSLCSTTICLYWARKQIKNNLTLLVALSYALFICFGFLDYFDTYIPRFSNLNYLYNFIRGGFLDVLLNVPVR
jgi:hypothetical protein